MELKFLTGNTKAALDSINKQEGTVYFTSDGYLFFDKDNDTRVLMGGYDQAANKFSASSYWNTNDLVEATSAQIKALFNS